MLGYLHIISVLGYQFLGYLCWSFCTGVSVLGYMHSVSVLGICTGVSVLGYLYLGICTGVSILGHFPS